MGIAPPTTPRRALLHFLFSRARLRLRGLSFTPREPEQIAAAEGHDDHDHDHEEGTGWSQLTTFFAGTSGLLLVLLTLSLLKSKEVAA